MLVSGLKERGSTLTVQRYFIRRMMFLLIGAGDGSERFKGGSIKRRDRWYGFDKMPDFHTFKRWYHREGKSRVAPEDLRSGDEVSAAYEEWVSLGRPTTR